MQRDPLQHDPPTAQPDARSYLFVPGNRPERFDKAWHSAADEIIIDLEDAVAPLHKDPARQAVAAWLDAARPVWVRINPTGSPWHEADLALAGCPGLAGFMVPKAEVLADNLVDACRRHGLRLIALIETAEGIRRTPELASCEAVLRLAFGALDFQADLDIEGDDDALLYFRSHLVLHSRLAGLAAPIDGITVVLHDAAVLCSEAQYGRSLGFGAKLCIHPLQAGAVNRVFSPSAAQREWAARVLAAMEASGGAPVALDGKMIDRPVWLKAHRIAAAPAADTTARLAAQL